MNDSAALPTRGFGRLWLLLGGCLGIVPVVLYCFDPDRFHFYPVCLFHRTTGLLCPGCGGLRAVHQLLHGHLRAAWHLNPLFVLSLPLVCWATARCFWLGHRPSWMRPTPSPRWLWCALVVIIAFGILRNLL